MTRQYNYSFEQKAKIAARKAVKEKEKEIKRLKKNLENKTTRLRAKKEALGVVQRAETDKISIKGTVMGEKQFDTLPKKVKTLLEEEKDRIKLIAENSTGFFYYITLRGVTGSSNLNID